MFKRDIEEAAKQNSNFRAVIHTGEHSQLVLMSLLVGEEIGEEVHGGVDQILFFVEGHGEVSLGGEVSVVGEDDVFFVPAGNKHNVRNTGHEPLKLFTVYSPPEHPDGTIHKTKQQALEEGT